MAITHSDAVANLLADTVGGAFDGGTGRLSVFTGAPVGAGAAQSGTELIRFTLPSDAFAAAASRQAALNSVSNVTALAGGTAASFVFWRTGDTAITSTAGASDRRIGGSVGTSGTDMIIDNATVVSGGTVVMNGWAWVAPS